MSIALTVWHDNNCPTLCLSSQDERCACLIKIEGMSVAQAEAWTVTPPQILVCLPTWREPPPFPKSKQTFGGMFKSINFSRILPSTAAFFPCCSSGKPPRTRFRPFFENLSKADWRLHGFPRFRLPHTRKRKSAEACLQVGRVPGS